MESPPGSLVPDGMMAKHLSSSDAAANFDPGAWFFSIGLAEYRDSSYGFCSFEKCTSISVDVLNTVHITNPDDRQKLLKESRLLSERGPELAIQQLVRASACMHGATLLVSDY